MDQPPSKRQLQCHFGNGRGDSLINFRVNLHLKHLMELNADVRNFEVVRDHCVMFTVVADKMFSNGWMKMITLQYIVIIQRTWYDYHAYFPVVPRLFEV